MCGAIVSGLAIFTLPSSSLLVVFECQKAQFPTPVQHQNGFTMVIMAIARTMAMSVLCLLVAIVGAIELTVMVTIVTKQVGFSDVAHV